MLEQRQRDLTLVMDNVNKPHNLAAIIRSCDAVGIHQIHAVSYRSAIRAKQHTAAGANKWVKLNLEESIANLYTKLRGQGVQIVVASFRPEAVNFRSIDYTLPTAIVVGEELKGPSTDAICLADKSIYIPMAGIVDSLNVSVAAAIILFEAQQQREKAGMYGTTQIPADEFDRQLFEYAYPRLCVKLKEEGVPYPVLDDNGAFMIDPFLT
jgi:tRNA (guanosine-2'-O-)-methyltransferase